MRWLLLAFWFVACAPTYRAPCEHACVTQQIAPTEQAPVRYLYCTTLGTVTEAEFCACMCR